MSRKTLIAVVLIFTVLIIGGWAFLIRQMADDCDDRLNNIAEPHIYPNSSISRLDEGHSSATYYFDVDVSSEQVISYYDSVAACFDNSEDNVYVCDGSASPFGEYVVIIDKGQGPTTSYTAFVEWYQCGDDYVTTE